jgi:hypothetical protein
MSDAQLADEVKNWRGPIPARKAAEVLGIPERTLNGIEQGRGFRYPRLLKLAMQSIVPANQGEKP